MTNRMINLVAFAILSLLWLALAAGWILSGDSLNAAWQAFAAWPLLLQLIVGLLTLPVAAAFWVAQTDWPLVVRLLLVAGICWATEYTFFPWKKQGQPAPEARRREV